MLDSNNATNKRILIIFAKLKIPEQDDDDGEMINNDDNIHNYNNNDIAYIDNINIKMYHI